MLSDNKITYEADFEFRFRYETLRSLLNKNGGILQILSDLEADMNHMRHYDQRIKRPIQRIFTETLLMAQELNLLSKNKYVDLYEIIFQLKHKTDSKFQQDQTQGVQPLIHLLDTSDTPDIQIIGGKAFGIWHLMKYFKDMVTPGFVVTTAAYNRILEENDLQNRIRILLTHLDVTEDHDRLQSRTKTIRNWIRNAKVPDVIANAIKEQIEKFQNSDQLLWAVRSSAVSEDGIHSFAGQFNSELQIEASNILTAYLNVIADRFTDRAVLYRIHNGFREVDTPMAVLIMPMVKPLAAGVIQTVNIKDSGSNTMIINSVPHLANKMVAGKEAADTFVVNKTTKEIKTIPIAENKEPITYINNDQIIELVDIASQAVEKMGYELDIEWAINQQGTLQLLQIRQLNTSTENETFSIKSSKKNVIPALEGGITIFPGRAEGPVIFINNMKNISNIPEGAIVVAEQPKLELAPILPKIAALLVMEGNPVGHLATLVREFAVPCIFQLGYNLKLLIGKQTISVNATKRTVYTGVRWPGIRERVLKRIASRSQKQKSGPLYDLILELNLLDPESRSFKAKSCKSVHDILRFMHEMSVRSMFGFGDQQNRGFKKSSRKLKTGLPIKLQLIDLDKSIGETKKAVLPEDVKSNPFQALWRGMSDKQLSWSNHWQKNMIGVPPEIRETLLGSNIGIRRAADANYAIIAQDYLNLNARWAYHYAMIDALVCSGTENNHIHFRFRGGGGSDENKNRRTRFLELVLRQFGFGVDRRGDLITAWYRRYPQKDSETNLENLGRLIVCARQLDAVLKNDNAIKEYVYYFINKKYQIFS